MRKVEEIEEQIQKLSREELAELREWFLEQDWNAWDAQIQAGRQVWEVGRVRFAGENRVRRGSRAEALEHYASGKFWALYEALPPEVRKVADKNHELLGINPRHASLPALQTYWRPSVGTGRQPSSRTGNRCTGRHPVGVDRHPQRIRQDYGITNARGRRS